MSSAEKEGSVPLGSAVSAFPHPHDIVLDRTMHCRETSLWFRQRLRHAMILGGTREIISERGIAGFTVKELSARVQLAPQTLYNLVGDRECILRLAIDELFVAAMRAAAAHGHGSQFLTALVDIFVFWSATTPEYQRNLTLSYFGREEPVYSTIRERVVLEIKRHLQLGLTVAGECYRLDVGQLAQCVHSFMAASALDWAVNNCSNDEFAQRLNVGTRLLLAA